MRRIHFPAWTTPFALLVLCFLSYGLFLPRLGLYFDDWSIIFVMRQKGIQGIQEFFSYDRPFGGWLYMLMYPLIGTKVMYWHVLALALRWLAVVFLWLTLRSIWPEQTRETTWAAFLFAVYPSFDQQAIAVTYCQVWLEFTLVFISFISMIQILRRPKAFWFFFPLSIITMLLNLSISEYFIGLEALRPIIIWGLVAPENPSRRQKWLKLIKCWLPYLLVGLVFVIWRLFLAPDTFAGSDRHSAVMLFDLAKQPFLALVNLLQFALQDFTYTVLLAWARIVKPTQILLSSRFFLASVAVSITGALFAAIYLGRLTKHAHVFERNTEWIRQAIISGLLVAILGFLPAWVTGRQAAEGMYGNRFTLVPMIGVSILIVGLIEWAMTSRLLPKVFVMGILIGTAIYFHIQQADVYVEKWIRQQETFWQIIWRAPYIEPGTPLISDSEILPSSGLYTTAEAISLLYPLQTGTNEINFYFFTTERNLKGQFEKFEEGKNIKETHRSMRFTGKSTDSLVIYRELNGCLRFLSADQEESKILPEAMQAVLPFANLEQIRTKAVDLSYPPEDIFGLEPAHTWCYYYQKADLARQFGDWEAVVRLGNEAEALGYKPEEPVEWIPFVEGYAQMGDWAKARLLTEKAFTNSTKTGGPLCSLWTKFKETPSLMPPRSDLNVLNETLECGWQ